MKKKEKRGILILVVIAILVVVVLLVVKNTKKVEEAREKITNNLDNIDKSIKQVLINENYPLDYKINYGDNYFPAKEYKKIKYEAGYYESVLVTLGEGKGKNWWCVLFPPLCLIEA